MMQERTANFVDLIPGTPVFGIWCIVCMTSGIVQITFYSLQYDGVWIAFTSNFCHTCNKQ